MDTPATNPSHASSHSWTNHHNGWPSPLAGSTQGLSCDPLPSLESLSLGSTALQSPCSNQPSLPPQNYKPQHPPPSTLHIENYKPRHLPPSTLPLENYKAQYPPQIHGLNHSLSSTLPLQNLRPQNTIPQDPHHAASPPPPHPHQAQTQGPWGTNQPGISAPILGCPPPSSPLSGEDHHQRAAPHRRPTSSSECRYGLDPALLPSAVAVMEEDQAEWEGRVFVSEPQSGLPPLATTDCTIQDHGSASPCAVRATSYCVPCEGQSALLSHLPLGALLTPLTPLSLPEVHEAEYVRGCDECGALMCPSMEWQDGGQRFHCPFCGHLNQVPWQQYQHAGREEKAELCRGSYQILHTLQEDAAVVFLALDVSAAALRAGHLDIITQQIHTLLREDGTVQSDVRVGLMTYDSRVHLYDLSPSLSRPHMLVVTEMEELELPVREGLLVPLRDCVDSLVSVLQQIPLFSPDWDVTSGVPMEMPVAAGLTVLKALGCPGKLLIFHTAQLTEATHTPSSPGFFSSNKPKYLFQPPESAVSLAKQCVSQGCGVHVFLLSQQNMGGAWAGHVPYLTGGALRCYDNLQGVLDRQRLSADLRRAVDSETCYKALVRIHISKDLRVSGSYGAFTPGPSPCQVAMATLDQQTTLAVEMTHSRALEERGAVVLQVAASYSTQTGQRMTRVHSVTLRCSRHLLDTFRHCQAQTLLAFYCKKMYCSVLECPLQELREELQSELTAALACYRKHCSSSSSVSTGQLVLPRALKALPVYVNSLRKSEVLLPGLRSSVHQRLHLRCQLVSMDTRATATHFYPTLLPLSAAVPLPACGGAVRCRAASLEPQGVYLLHGPLVLLLCLGSSVSSETLVLMFNCPSLSALQAGELGLVKQGASCDEALQRLLVEDRSPNGGASYSDFLYHLHVNSIRLLQ
ncbi:protein transport protein Sec24C [Aplochiton taeniatus]